MKNLIVIFTQKLYQKIKTIYKEHRFISYISTGVIVFMTIFAWLAFTNSSPFAEKREILSYSEFQQYLNNKNEYKRNKQIKYLILFERDRKIWGELSTDHYDPIIIKFETNIPYTKLNEIETIFEAMAQKGQGPEITFEQKMPKGIQSHLRAVFWMILGIGGLVGFLWFAQGRQSTQHARKFTKTEDKQLNLNISKVNFNDVGGCDEAKDEVKVLIEFLQHPEKFSEIGGKIPKGALLIGPPGTGKTLLARAIAGEAKRPFFPTAGSEFVEMFVGVGPARVRSLFKKAKANSPCVIFIDDLDSVGRARTTNVKGIGNQEYENTLLQLLVEMDGVEGRDGVIVMGATNIPERLDSALVRPGRFDKQIVINRPDIAGREEILQIHSRNIKIAKNVDLEKIARTVPGFVGADLANLVNEAAILATRNNKKTVGQKEFMQAKDRIILGSERRIIISNKEKKALAYHEAGHATVAIFSPHADPVEKITIIPHGLALGITLLIPKDDKLLITKKQALAQLRIAMAGRVGEKLITKDLSSGAGNDLERATLLARRMVCQWGMSDTVGPVVYSPPSEAGFLNIQHIDFNAASEEVRRQIEQEVRKLMTTAEKQAETIVKEQIDGIKKLVKYLLKKETLESGEIYKILNKKP